jgi:hypothetical protein
VQKEHQSESDNVVSNVQNLYQFSGPKDLEKDCWLMPGILPACKKEHRSNKQ